MNVIILGCGPTGLAAAHACALHGHNVSIISRMTKSKLYGAQYLHEPIPGLNYPKNPIKVSYELKGTREEYAAKIYGNEYNGTVSPDEYEGEHEAWDIRWSYDQLWDKYMNYIVDVRDIRIVLEDVQRFPGLVINTVPKPSLCSNPIHNFDKREIWAMGDAPGYQSVPIRCFPNTVLCSGQADDPWYRVSDVYGYRTMEWASWRRPMLNGNPMPAAKVSKPLSNNCDCNERFLHVGRYGKWQKGVVVHHAFHEVMEAVS